MCGVDGAVVNDALFRLDGAVWRDAAITAWFGHQNGMRQMVRPWFEEMRACGPDVREVLHDGCPNACVGNAPFAYIHAFNAHANVGFFHGATLDDPAGLLEGRGKRMRHVKLRWGETVNDAALGDLIAAAYQDIRLRLKRLE
jgi:hypothetical protein